MTELLDAAEAILADLLSSGLENGGADAARKAEELSGKMELCGLHCGSRLLAALVEELNHRSGLLIKRDAAVTEAVFRMEEYLTLCRRKWQAESVARRWAVISAEKPDGSSNP